MNRRNTHQKANKRKGSWLGKLRKDTTYVLLTVMCLVALVTATATPTNMSEMFSAENEDNHLMAEAINREAVPSTDEESNNNLVESMSIEIAENEYGTEEAMSDITIPEATNNNDDFQKDSSTTDVESYSNSEAEVENDEGTEALKGKTITSNPNCEYKPVIVPLQQLLTKFNEESKGGIQQQLKTDGLDIIPIKIQVDPDELISNQDSHQSESDGTEEANGDTTVEPSNESEQQTEGDTETNDELEKIMNDIYLECGYDPNWNIFEGNSNETGKIWIEQWQPLTEELIIGLGNLIMREVGGYISTQSYEKAIKIYMVTGSVPLHRLQVGYTSYAKDLYDVVNAKGQYEGTNYAFNSGTKVAGSVEECYIVAEKILRDGPIGPRNLVFQSTGKQGTTYWDTGADVHFRTTYFGTSSKFADYDSEN